MDSDARRTAKRPDVLRKLNKESLAAIERGLLGDIPLRLRPQRPTTLDIPSRHLQLEKAKPTGLLSSCLPIVQVTPTQEISTPLEESVSPLKKTFSFRDKLARMNIFGKEKSEKSKLKEDPLNDLDSHVMRTSSEPVDLAQFQGETKTSKKFWFFKNKDQPDKKEPSSPTSLTKEPRWFRKQKTTSLYVRSKSFEFLPRAMEEDCKEKTALKPNRHSFIFGSRDSMGTAWTSNDSLQFLAPKASDDEDVFSKPQSSASTMNTSTESSIGGIETIFERESVQDLLGEFDKAVELFQNENYLSDSELYKKRNLPKLAMENRKSSSFSALPSSKIVQTNASRGGEATDTFKRELTSVLSAKNAMKSVSGRTTARRGSVTDWSVLDEKKINPRITSETQRRTQKKPTNRVRRISSTKYVETAAGAAGVACDAVPSALTFPSSAT